MTVLLQDQIIKLTGDIPVTVVNGKVAVIARDKLTYTRSTDSRSTVEMNRAAIWPPRPVVCAVAWPWTV